VVLPIPGRPATACLELALLPVARLTRAVKGTVPAFDLEAFLDPVTAQSFHPGDSAAWIREFRAWRQPGVACRKAWASSVWWRWS